jgi:hypothetical protein
MPSFDETAIFTYRRFLEASLLIEELRPGFDAIEKLFALSSPDWEPPPPPPPPSPDPRKFQFVLFDFQFHVGGNSNRLEVSGSIRKTNNDKMSEVKLIGVVDPNPDFLANPNNFKKVDFTVLGQGAPDGEVTWENAGFVFLHLKNNEDGDDACINILEIKATDANGVSYSLHSKENFEICVPSQDTISRLIPLAAPPPLPDPPKPLEPLQRLTPDERSARARLIAHLNANKPYYYRQIWMGEDPNHRLIRMAGTKVDIEGNVVGLFETVENRVVDVVGNQLVFPLAPGLLSSPDRSGAASELVDRFTPAISETLISLPTRGVFGEAKLGHCNASEIIDNTRFWDWQTSPCPEEAPAITGVSPQGLGAPTILTPTALPASILSIQAPQAEPDPIGLKSALDALKTPGIFNNMSGIDALKGLLTSLSDAAAKVLAPSKPEEPSPKPNPSPTPSPNPSPGQTPPKGSTTGSTSGSPSGSTSGSTSGSPSGSTSGSTTQPQPPTPQPQPSSQQPAPTPVYKGKALRKVLVSVTKGGSQELYCSGSVVVERQDVVGDKIEGQFNGGNGNVSLNLPSEWKSLIVRLYDLNILPEPFTEPPVASVGPLITGLITGNENQLTTVQFNYPAAKEIDFSVPPEIYVNGKKP